MPTLDYQIRQNLRFSLGIVLLLALLWLPYCAQAGPFARAQNPDDWSNAPEHFLIVGMVPGVIVGTAWPEMHPAKQFALCSIPGLFHEFEPSPSNTWSRRDLFVNSLGCGFGLWAATGFRLAPLAGGGVQMTYSIAIQ
jgi:hypothetical protein